MKEKLFLYFKEYSSNQALIYSHMPIFHLFFRFVIYSLMVSALSTGFSMLFLKFHTLWFVISLSITLLLIVAMIRLNKVFDLKAMKILKKQYSLNSSPDNWNLIASDIQVHMISEYLIKNDVYSRWKIERLIDAYQKDNEKRKLPPLVAPGIIIAISIPNLTQLLIHIYAYYNSKENLPPFIQSIKDPELIINTTLFFVIFIVTVMLASSISKLNKVIEDIKQMLTDRDGPKRDGLTSTLENILFQLKEKDGEEHIQSPYHGR